MEIRRVGVIGAGQMGNGIAHVFALAGFDVVLHDVSERGARDGARGSSAATSTGRSRAARSARPSRDAALGADHASSPTSPPLG